MNLAARALTALAVLALAAPAFPCPAGQKATTTAGSEKPAASSTVAKADKAEKAQKSGVSEKGKQQQKAAN